MWGFECGGSIVRVRMWGFECSLVFRITTTDCYNIESCKQHLTVEFVECIFHRTLSNIVTPPHNVLHRLCLTHEMSFFYFNRQTSRNKSFIHQRMNKTMWFWKLSNIVIVIVFDLPKQQRHLCAASDFQAKLDEWRTLFRPTLYWRCCWTSRSVVATVHAFINYQFFVPHQLQ